MDVHTEFRGVWDYIMPPCVEVALPKCSMAGSLAQSARTNMLV